MLAHISLCTFIRKMFSFAMLSTGMLVFGNDLLGKLVVKDNHMHTYIIGHYNPSVRIIDLVSHLIYVVWRNFYLLSEFLSKTCWEEIAEEIVFLFCFHVWPDARTLALRIISHHTTYWAMTTYVCICNI